MKKKKDQISDVYPKPKPSGPIKKALGCVAWAVFIPAIWIHSKLTGKGLDG